MSTAAWIMILLGVLGFGLGFGYRLGRWASSDGMSFEAEKWRLRYIYMMQACAAAEEQARALEEQANLSRGIANELLERKLQQ